MTLRGESRELIILDDVAPIPRKGNEMTQPPIGAIENGRTLFDRLANHYDFECEGGPLANCTDFHELRRCFEAMAEWIGEEAGDWEPTEAQQGLIPIPEGYNEP